ncbi:uncharacterized protein [Antedon mediterranea]|uniref:uncharacterized protein n=1 Tax=Antedon mediterranea TaxID=105859 RepID=UPI003AF42DB0
MKGPVRVLDGFSHQERSVCQLAVANESDQEVVVDAGTILGTAVDVKLADEIVVEQINGCLGVMIGEVAVEEGVTTKGYDVGSHVEPIEELSAVNRDYSFIWMRKVMGDTLLLLTVLLALLSIQLVFYISTPHRATNVAPYKLMYGRQPTIPLDQLIHKTHQDWENDYVQRQADALQKAAEIAERKIKMTRESDKRLHDDRVVKSKPFKVGEQVLLKQTAFTGRHKLVDRYHREPYIIEDVNREEDVYKIRPALGGKVKTVNRKLIIQDPRDEILEEWPMPLRPEVDEENKMPLRPEVDEENDCNDSSDEEEDFLLQIEIPEMPDRVVEQEIDPVRRSVRVNKGTHSNPGQWPRSVFEK